MIQSQILPELVSPAQHGFVPRRGIITCWKSIINLIQQMPWIYEYDLSTFFDGINHKLLIETIVNKLKVPHKDQKRWKRIIRMSVHDKSKNSITPTLVGMPQGLPISPVLCIQALEKSGFLDPLHQGTIIQYVDDGLVLSETEIDVRKASNILNGRSRDGIEINHDKSRIINSKTDSLKFTGLTLSPDGELNSTPKSGNSFNIGNINKPEDINWKRIFYSNTTNTSPSSTNHSSDKYSIITNVLNSRA